MSSTFSIEAKAVQNGWVVSVWRVRDDGSPVQMDYIVENGSIKTFIGGLVDQEVDAAVTWGRDRGRDEG